MTAKAPRKDNGASPMQPELNSAERTWFQRITFLLAILTALGGFASWVVGEARAQGKEALQEAREARKIAETSSAQTREAVENLRKEVKQDNQRIEQKVDKILERMLDAR